MNFINLEVSRVTGFPEFPNINDSLFILTCINFCSQNNDGSHKISGDSLNDLYKSFVLSTLLSPSNTHLTKMTGPPMPNTH
jgi:hypothetical protein